MAAKQDDGPISDLDAIIVKSVPFRFKGKIHRLDPINLEDFLKFTSAQATLMTAMSNQELQLSAKDLAQKIFNVFSSVCSTLTLDDVLAMEQVQVAALYQLVLDMVTGQVDMGEGKKKRAKIPLYDIVRASFSPNAQRPSAGTQKPR